MGAWDVDDAVEKDTNLFGLNVLGEKWVGTIDKAQWKTDPRVNNGETVFLEMEIDTGHPNPEFTTLKYSYKAGDKFETNDGGKSITPIQEGKKVHGASGFGILLDHVLKMKDAVEVMSKQAGSPLEAAAWEGLTFTWGVHEKEYKGDIGKVSRWMPISFGADESVVQGSAAPETEPKSREELEAELTTLAKESENADDYLAKAMNVDGFTDHDDLVSGYKKFYTAANK